jgi:hypothetical protein
MNRSALLGKALLEVLAEFAVFAVLLFISGLRGHHAHRHRGRRERAG